MPSYSSMRVLTAIATTLLVAFAPVLALAQESVAGVPDTSYEASTVASAPAEPTAVPMPDVDPGGDGSIVTVPIPGGGSVTVEGPAATAESSLLSPIETWAGSTQTPNSIAGTSPLGP